MGKTIKLKPFEPYQRTKPEDFRIEDIPFYEPGKPPRHDLWGKLDFSDEEERLFGRKWGAQGIGKLREVLVCRPSENEIHPIFKKDPTFYMFYDGQIPDIEKMQKEHDELVKIYKQAEIEVHYLEFPSSSMGPYGPMRWMVYAPRAFLVIRGGAIIQRSASVPFAKGREIYEMRALVELGCPILYTVHGKGIFEIGASLFIAEDVFFTGRSIAYNQDGLEQVTPVLKRAGVKEIVVNHIPGPLYSLRWPMGGTFHPDMFIGVLDIGVVLVYPPWCGYETIEWLRDHRFKMIEVSAEEQRKCGACNCLCLEPGKVVMPAGARKTIKEVEKAGIEVIAVEFSEIWKGPGGIRCATGELVRDPGPGLEDIHG